MKLEFDSKFAFLLKKGLFSVNKRKGITSALIVELVKRTLIKELGKISHQFGKIKVGHGGTLDSSATGVLVIGVNEGCQLLTHMLHGGKSYHVIGKLGVATDTYNDIGTITHEAPFDWQDTRCQVWMVVSWAYMVCADGVRREDLESCLQGYIGHIMQVPPPYSALKMSGVRLSDLARSGKEVLPKSRLVECQRVVCCGFSPPLFYLKVSSGPGFYVRSLVHDIGIELGCYAHVTGLVRTRQGPFTLEHSLDLEDLSVESILEAVKKFNLLSIRATREKEAGAVHSPGRSRRGAHT